MENNNAAKQNLLILGAGDLGQAIAEIAIASGLYNSISFLDDISDDEKQEQAQVIGGMNDLNLFVNEYELAIVAIGNNQTRKALRCKVKDAGYHEATIVHPSAVISPTVIIGSGTIIRENVCISRKAIIGEGVILNMGVLIDHNCVIGDNSHLSMGAVIRNNCHIDSLSMIRPGEVIQ